MLHTNDQFSNSEVDVQSGQRPHEIKALSPQTDTWSHITCQSQVPRAAGTSDQLDRNFRYPHPHLQCTSLPAFAGRCSPTGSSPNPIFYKMSRRLHDVGTIDDIGYWSLNSISGTSLLLRSVKWGWKFHPSHAWVALWQPHPEAFQDPPNVTWLAEQVCLTGACYDKQETLLPFRKLYRF